MWATIIIAESFTRIMGSTAGNVYSRFLQYNFMDPGWGGGRISYGGQAPSPPAGASAELVHWPLMGGLVHLVQRGGDWAGLQPTQALPCCTKRNSPPINGQCTDHRIGPWSKSLAGAVTNIAVTS